MSKAARTTLVVLVIATAVGGGAWSASRALIQRNDVYTDDDSILTDAQSAAPRDVLWRPAERVVLGDDEDDIYEPYVSHDGTTLVFVKGSPGGGADLYESRRAGDGWSIAVPIVGVNTDADEISPYLSRDGVTLYFASDRAGGIGGYDIWTAQRTDHGWSDPTPLGESVNSQLNEYGPALTRDGELLFASNRPRPDELAALTGDEWPGSVIDRFRDHDYDLYRVDPSSDGTATRIDALSSPQSDVAPAVSPAGDFVYFASDRLGGVGGFDLYRARIIAGGFGEVEHLDGSINSSANELDPTLSYEGFGLHFSSNRGLAQDEGPRDRFGVYFTTSREVFRRTDVTRAQVDWAALWRAIWPWLTSVIAALLLLWIVNHLSRPEFRRRWRTLSLMAKCVIVSLLAHALLLLLFTALHVTTEISDLITRPESRVKIVSSAVRSGDIQQQIYGELTEFTIEASVGSTTPRNESGVATASAPSNVEVAPGQMSVKVRRVAEAEMNESDTVRTAQPVEMAEAQPAQMEQGVRTPSDARVVRTAEATPSVPQTALSTEIARAEMTESANVSRDVRHAAHVDAMSVSVQAIESLSERPTEARPEKRAELARSAPVEVAPDLSTPIETPQPRRADARVESSRTIEMTERALTSTVTAALRVEPSSLASAELRPESQITPAAVGAEASANPTESRGQISRGAPRLAAVQAVWPDAGDLTTPSDRRTPTRSAEAAAGITGVASNSSPVAKVSANATASGSSHVAVDLSRVDVADTGSAVAAGTRSAREATMGQRGTDVRLASAAHASSMVALPSVEAGAARVQAEIHTRSAKGRRLEGTTGNAPSAALAADAVATSGRVDVAPKTAAIRESGVSFARTGPPSDASPIRSAGVRGSTVESFDSPEVDIALVPETSSARSMSGGGREAAAVLGGAALSARSARTPTARAPVQSQSEASGREGSFNPSPIALADTSRTDRGVDGSSISDARPRRRPGVASRSQLRAPPIGPGVLAMPTDLGAPMAAPPMAIERDFKSVRASARRSPTPSPRPRESTSPRSPSTLRIDPLRIDDVRMVHSTSTRESTPSRTSPGPGVAVALPGPGVGRIDVPTEQIDPNQLLLSGVVFDAETREPLEGAIVRLDAEGAASLRVRTDAMGRFGLSPINVPTHVAVTASSKGYTPEARNVSAESLRRGASAVFLLWPERLEVVVLEPDPQVRHLGNDEFTGSINSQFQMASEGVVYSRRFVLEHNQVAPAIKRAEIRLLAKGAQTRNQIRINGRLVERRLTDSPSDGSFGEIRARFPVKWLRTGRNVIEIRSVRERGTDLDDFEFVNIRIHLERARPSSAF